MNFDCKRRTVHSDESPGNKFAWISLLAAITRKPFNFCCCGCFCSYLLYWCSSVQFISQRAIEEEIEQQSRRPPAFETIVIIVSWSSSSSMQSSIGIIAIKSAESSRNTRKLFNRDHLRITTLRPGYIIMRTAAEDENGPLIGGENLLANCRKM